MEDNNKKEQTAEEKLTSGFGGNLLSAIIAKTYARHAGQSEEEFLESIGFKDSGKTESEAVRIALYNVLIEATKQLIQAENTIKSISGVMRLALESKENKKESK